MRRWFSAEARVVRVFLAASLVATGAVVAARGAAWPQFRGPERDGVSKETGLARDWPAGGPRVVWRTKLGSGYSAISVEGERLYTLLGRGGEELAVALSAATGEEVWRAKLDSEWKDQWGNGPRSTPTVHEGIVYALSSGAKLHALRAEDGSRVWMRDLQKDFRARPPQWGASSSPLVDGKRLLVDVGGAAGSSIVAFDRKTGEELWRSQDDKAGYSAPIAVEVGGVRMILALTGTRLVALSPENGSAHWAVPWTTSYDVNAATPVLVPPDKVFISTGYDVGSALFRIKAAGEGKTAVEELWRSRDMKNKFSSSVYRDGHLYGFDEKNLICLDAATGKSRWEARGLGHGSLIYADGHFIVLGDEGILALVEATPEAYREKARAQPFEGRTWTMPVLSGGRLYLRDQSEIVALDVSAKSEPAKSEPAKAS